jgi:hypothetical protein
LALAKHFMVVIGPKPTLQRLQPGVEHHRVDEVFAVNQPGIKHAGNWGILRENIIYYCG